MSLLEDCDPEAEVRIMSQQSWPFENAIAGMAVREDFGGEQCECNRGVNEEHEEDCPADEPRAEGLAANDVFILEGAQERYGDKDAWNAARR